MARTSNKYRNKNKNRYRKHKDKLLRKSFKVQNEFTEKEDTVGITEFMNNTEGFTGYIKAKYSDFHVNEIGIDGKIANLTDPTYPKFEANRRFPGYQDVEITPSAFIPQETWTAIRNLAWDQNGEPIYLNINDFQREDIIEIYSHISRHFHKKIVINKSTTIDPYFKRVMEFKYNENGENNWPGDKGDFMYFLVKKEMINTIDASILIANGARIDASKVMYAEDKDKRGITTQWFCVKRVEPWKLVHGTKNHRNVEVGNFIFKDKPLRFGELKGNHFRIALRRVTAEYKVVEESLNQLKENGFVNYYGLQMFGNDMEIPSFEIGIKLLQCKWQEAVNLILKPRAFDNPMNPNGDVVEAKKVYADTNNAEDAYAKIKESKYKSIEAKLLESLKQTIISDWYGAINKIPRRMVLFYINSLQCLIWNRMVSKRLQLFGKQPVEGDLVLINQNVVDGDIKNAKERIKIEAEESENEDGISEIGMVKSITAEDLPNYTIYDIVLPTPGYGVTYPTNMEQYYKDALEELELSDILKQKSNAYSPRGGYRKIVRIIDNLSWKSNSLTKSSSRLINPYINGLRETSRPKNENFQVNAVVLEFSLPRHSCPRMVLREIVKTHKTTKENNTHDSNGLHENEQIPDEKVISPHSSATDLQDMTEELQTNKECRKRKLDMVTRDQCAKRIKDEKPDVCYETLSLLDEVKYESDGNEVENPELEIINNYY